MSRLDLPKRRTINPPTHCTKCNTKLTLSNRYKYVGYVQGVCKSCKKIIAKAHTDKRKKALEMFKRF